MMPIMTENAPTVALVPEEALWLEPAALALRVEDPEAAEECEAEPEGAGAAEPELLAEGEEPDPALVAGPPPALALAFRQLESFDGFARTVTASVNASKPVESFKPKLMAVPTGRFTFHVYCRAPVSEMRVVIVESWVPPGVIRR